MVGVVLGVVMVIPDKATAPDGTTFNFWIPRADPRYRECAKFSYGLGATICHPNGRVDHTWGNWLRSIFRAKMGMSLRRYIRGKPIPHIYRQQLAERADRYSNHPRTSGQN